jgi:REP element-mobilizing transposase RayT
VTTDDSFGPLAYAVVICTLERAPVLERSKLAHIAAQTWREVVGRALLASAVLPDQVRAVIEAPDLQTLNRWVEAYKVLSQARLLEAIHRFYADDLLDAVMLYSPVWPGVVCRLWQAGYHCEELFSEESVTRKVGALGDLAWYTPGGNSASGDPPP